MSPGLIDAHVHLWDLLRRDQGWIAADSPIRRSFDRADLAAVAPAAGVHSVVLVQVLNDAGETDDFLAEARSNELIAGVVGWADLANPGLSNRVGELADAGPLVGLRHQLQAEPDPSGWLGRPDVDRGLADLERLGMVFDLMIRPEQFPAALAAVRRHPSLRFVLDHIGKPPIATGSIEPWGTGLRLLAAEENIVCKLSGMVTVADPHSWTVADIRRFTDLVIEAFGPSRLMFGSDWPVSMVAASYAQVVDVGQACCAELSESERALVMGACAREIYRLNC